MTLSLPLKALSLIKYFLTYSGEKEINQKGEEVDATRRLSGEESSQRRHFMKVFNPEEEKSVERLNLYLKEHQEKVEEKRKGLKEKLVKEETEKDEDYEKRINITLDSDPELIASTKEANEKIKKEYDDLKVLEITDKTFEVLKKYFKEFGEKVGFKPGDDEAVEKLEEVLK